MRTAYLAMPATCWFASVSVMKNQWDDQPIELFL